jgi:hypothetical protein
MNKELTLPELIKLHDLKLKERDECREKAKILNKELRTLKELITINLKEMVISNDRDVKIDPNCNGWNTHEIKY